MKLVYIGQRWNGSKLHQAFLPVVDGAPDVDGESRIWVGLKALVIGAYYEGKENGDSVQMSTSPKPVDGERAPDELADEWWACERSAKSAAAEARELKRLSERTPPNVTKAIRALAPIVKSLSYAQTRTLVEYVVQQARRNPQ